MLVQYHLDILLYIDDDVMMDFFSVDSCNFRFETLSPPSFQEMVYPSWTSTPIEANVSVLHEHM